MLMSYFFTEETLDFGDSVKDALRVCRYNDRKVYIFKIIACRKSIQTSFEDGLISNIPHLHSLLTTGANICPTHQATH